MKAIVLKNAGSEDLLEIQELPIPSLHTGEVLVKVKAISVNPVDIKTRNGKAMFQKLQEEPPVILGWDISGEIIDTTQNTSFKKGDQVFGMINFPGSGKAYAEFVAAPASHLALKPASLSFEDAAAACLAALTAWQVVAEQMKIEKGQRLLVNAAAGGVGHFVVQIAKSIGAYVVGTASPENYSFLKSIGTDEVVDYHNADAMKSIEPVDHVFDPIGGQTTKLSYLLLKPGGSLISIVGGVKDEDAELIRKKNIRASNYLVHSSGDNMKKLAELISQGKIKTYVSHVFPFEKMADAHRQIETGKTRGKIVVNVR